MNLKSLNLKLAIGIIYLVILSVGIYTLLSFVDIRDLMSYDFIRSNKDIILEYRRNSFLILTIIFLHFPLLGYYF